MVNYYNSIADSYFDVLEVSCLYVTCRKNSHFLSSQYNFVKFSILCIQLAFPLQPEFCSLHSPYHNIGIYFKSNCQIQPTAVSDNQWQ